MVAHGQFHAPVTVATSKVFERLVEVEALAVDSIGKLRQCSNVLWVRSVGVLQRDKYVERIFQAIESRKRNTLLVSVHTFDESPVVA